MVCNPDEQKRFTVQAGTVSGRPAFIAMTLPILFPWSCSGQEHPIITSSISAGSKSSVLLSTSLMASAARSVGRVYRSVPLPDLPTAVLAPDTITASRIFYSSKILLQIHTR
jgi:hypothetical protein